MSGIAYLTNTYFHRFISFPISWYWVQCNAFENYLGNLAVTAGGGRRKLPFMGKFTTEDLGMIGIHYNGTFYEAVPWVRL